MNENINDNFNINNGLQSVVKISWFLLPLLILQIVLFYLNLYKLDTYQAIIICICIVFFTSINFLKSLEIFQRHYYKIQTIFLFILILFEFLWYTEGPNNNQLYSLILGITITGVALLKPKITIIFYVVTVIILFIVNYLNAYDFYQYVNYFFISAICIVTFNIWRDKLFNKIENSENSYKLIFNDSQALIFIINSTDFNIIEYNNSASKFFSNKDIKGLKFTEIVTCDKEKKDVLEYLNIINNDSKHSVLETICTEDNSKYIPKEFYFRKSLFFNQDVIIITIKLIKERKEKERQLNESKKNITQILDNINSFVYNISLHDNGDRRVKFVSAKAEEILKIELDDLVVMFKRNKTKDLIYPDDLSFVDFKMKEANRTLLPQVVEYRLIINNEIRWFEEKVFPKRENDYFIHFGIITDITNEKNSELKLINSEQKYRQLYEESLAGIFKTNLDGKIIEANQAFANILGITSVDELKNKNIKEFYFEEFDRKNYLNELVKEKALRNYIVVLKRTDGKRIIVSNNVFYITVDRESFITGTLIDVTELHETTEALKENEIKLIESQNTFKNIVDSSPAALFIFDNNDELVFLNPLAQNLYEDCLNNDSKKLNEIFEVKQFITIQSVIKESVESIQSYTEITLGKKDFVLQAVKVKYNSIESNLILLRDISLEQEYNLQKARAEQAEYININLEEEISRHKNTQKLLLENTKFTENVLDSSLDMIIASDKNRVINAVNTATLLRLGYTKDEMIGQKIDILYANESDTKVVFNAINETEKFIGEIENKDKKGKLFKSFLSATTIKNDEGEVIGYMGVSRDLSEIEEIKKVISDQSSLIESLFKSESNVFIWVTNKEMNLVSFNESTNTYFKALNKKPLKKEANFIEQIKDILDKEQLKQLESAYIKVFDAQKIELELLVFDNKENKYWIDIHLSPIVLPNGDVEEIICIGHDITDKKQKIEQIEENESNIRAVIKAIPDMIFKVSVTGEVLDYEINSDEQKMIVSSFVKNNEDLIGRNIKEIFIDIPEFLDEILFLIKNAISTEKILTQNFEYKLNNVLIHFENRFSKVNNKEAIIVIRNRTEEIENEQKLIDSIHEKEILLKEVHHRVKNNLQIINSILNLQSSYVTDEKTLEIINESQNRIRSMAYIHESLYQSNNFSSINFKDYIENLITNLIYSYQIGNNINVIKNINQIDLALDQAIPCGLILNEIITNALKYAYPNQDKGDILISIIEEKNKIEIIVEDFGVGLPKNFDIETSESLGLSLVHTLVDQIDGELIVNSNGGTKFLIIFEKLES